MKLITASGDKLIQDLAHNVLTSKGINWAEAFGSTDDLIGLLDGFDLTAEDIPNILANFSNSEAGDYELTDAEARLICRNFIGDPDIEELWEPYKTGVENEDEIFFKIFSDFIECNNHLTNTIEEFVTAKPWGVWQTETTFYKLAPNALLHERSLTRAEYVKKCTLDIYGRGAGRRKYKCEEAPKPISFF